MSPPITACRKRGSEQREVFSPANVSEQKQTKEYCEIAIVAPARVEDHRSDGNLRGRNEIGSVRVFFAALSVVRFRIRSCLSGVLVLHQAVGPSAHGDEAFVIRRSFGHARSAPVPPPPDRSI